MSAALAKLAKEVVEGFPEAFVQALEQQGVRQAFRVLPDPAPVNRVYQLYAVHVSNVFRHRRFLWHGVFDAPDAQKCSICELAVMESQLTDAEKDAALFEVRKTAPKAIIEFEHYVPLLIPSDGTCDDKACCRTAADAIVDHRNVVPSVFTKDAIWLAQSGTRGLQPPVVLVAVPGRTTRAHDQQPGDAAEIWTGGGAAHCRPADLPARARGNRHTHGRWPRTAAEVDAIFDDLLRERGLGAVADSIKARRSRPTAAGGAVSNVARA